MENFNKMQLYYNTDFYNTLTLVQRKISSEYPDLFSEDFFISSEEDKKQKIRGCIDQYVREHNLKVKNIPNRETLSELLYNDMVKESVLTDYIEDSEDKYEEININAWNDIEVHRRDGVREKIAHFCSPKHAYDVLKRMAAQSGAKLDAAMPMCEANLKDNTRIAILAYPLVDLDVYVAASIRMVKPTNFKRDKFLSTDTLNEQEMEFLEMAVKHGISTLFVGPVGSGKTTLLNYILTTFPNLSRIYSIENNARELSLVKKDSEGNIINSVVHTITHPSDDPKYTVDEDLLLEKALRFDPDLIAVGEMRSAESYAAEEASLSGHTVVSTIHSFGARAAHLRVVTLCNKKHYNPNTQDALLQAAMAFPLIVCIRRLNDNHRHVMEITECEIVNDTERKYNKLFGYQVDKNEIDPKGNFTIKGHHQTFNKPGPSLIQTMINCGATTQELKSIGLI